MKNKVHWEAEEVIIPPKKVRVEDYKCTSVWSIIYPKESWTNQLNVYAWLLRQNNYLPKSLSIIVLARDWQKSKAQEAINNGGNYPPLPIHKVDIPLWSDEKQDAYVLDRIERHQQADMLFHTQNIQVGCTDEERWKNAPSFAVKVKEKKRALKVFDLEEDAQDYAKNTLNSYVEERPSIARRCKDYCNVKQFCELAKKEGYVE